VWISHPERGRGIESFDGFDEGFRDAKPKEGGGDSFVRDGVKGLGPIQKEYVNGCIMPIEQLQNTANNMYRLGARAAYSKAKLVRAKSGVEGALQPCMQHAGIYLVKGLGQGDGSIVTCIGRRLLC